VRLQREERSGASARDPREDASRDYRA
jgi:hypothetical protein